MGEAMNIRDYRLISEWRILEVLAAANQDIFGSISRSSNEYQMVLRNSPAWVRQGTEMSIETEHALRYVYPRYYPALPLECYLDRPICHINVHSRTGFVCLWRHYSARYTILDAVLTTRRVMSGRVANHAPEHVMQRVPQEACSTLPPMEPLIIPPECRAEWAFRRSNRRRLSTETNQESQLAFSHHQ
jgi:hypothetical protein